MLAEARRESEAADLHRDAAHRWHEYGFALEEAFALLGVARCGGGAAARADAERILARLGVANEPALRAKHGAAGAG